MASRSRTGITSRACGGRPGQPGSPGRTVVCMGEAGMIAAAPAAGSGDQIRAGGPGALAVSVALAPQESVIGLLFQAASGQSLGAPAGLLAAIPGALRPRARFAAQMFTARGWTEIPDSATPISPLADASVAEQAARLRDLPAAELTDELHAAQDRGSCLPHSRAAADQPRRWLDSMADASLDIWAVAEPRWRAAGPLLDREIRRIGTAAVRGGMTALLNSLHPGITYRDGTFSYTPPCNPSLTFGPLGPVGPRRLALLPMIAGRDSVLFSFGRPGVCAIGYPIPRPSAPATPGSALATILGPVRAAILQALRQPLTVSALAAAVQCAPTTATYHLHQLTAAGLITREKAGPAVQISRTTRGDELVDLLSD
jgi:DNA-binding transcriptional ArsR family regulator